MSGDRVEPGPELEFEHIGSMKLDDRLLLCDVEYAAPRFSGLRSNTGIGLDFEVEVRPGIWELLVGVGPDRAGEPAIHFVVLTHEAELETDLPLDQADAVALLRVDSGRITALDPALRGDADMQLAMVEAPRDQVPCMLTPLAEPGGSEPRPGPPAGALVDVDVAGVFEVYAPPGEPRSTIFLAVAHD